MDTEDPVIVFRCSGDTEADVVRSLLESCGIPASKDSDISHIAYPLKYDGLGEVRLRVPAALADEARRVIEEAREQGRVTGDALQDEIAGEADSAAERDGGGKRAPGASGEGAPGSGKA